MQVLGLGGPEIENEKKENVFFWESFFCAIFFADARKLKTRLTTHRRTIFDGWEQLQQ